MTRACNVVDSDGHVLEPLKLRGDNNNPAFRKRRLRFLIVDNGNDRRTVERNLLADNPCGRARTHSKV